MADDNQEQRPLEVYFDGSCPICEAEIEELRRGDDRQSLTLIDCSTSNFAESTGEDRPAQADMLRALHVRDNGQWVSGPAAFARIYERMGMTRMARLWGSRTLKPLVDVVYRLFVVSRPLLARLGLARVVRWFVRRELRHRGPDVTLDPQN